jgi:hypothetical protein
VVFSSGIRGILISLAGLVMLIVGLKDLDYRKPGWPLIVSPIFSESLNVLTEPGILPSTSVTAFLAHHIYLPIKERTRNISAITSLTDTVQLRRIEGRLNRLSRSSKRP